MPEVACEITVPDVLRTFHSFREAAEAGYPFACEVFALCDRPADVAISHPILDAVPACERCAARVAALEEA